LLSQLGYQPFQEWGAGFSMSLDGTYVVFELAKGAHDRRVPGLSHLAFHAGTPRNVDALVASAPDHGWHELYADRFPHAGSDDSYAAFFENDDRFKVELVAEGAYRAQLPDR
jgi:hypothetical protein